MDSAETTIRDRGLSYRQKAAALARLGEERIAPLHISRRTEELRSARVVCDLMEGPAPWRPRYILPDYEAYFRKGSEFLRIEAPRDLLGAVFALLSIYRQIPSITGYPVWLGDLDSLLEPFALPNESDGLAPEQDRILRMFMEQIDRDLPDSFCHADLGPRATRVGRAILRHQRGAARAVPNLSLRYDSELTEDSFAEEAASCALDCAKPSFANHRLFQADFDALGLGPYAIASCYNGLPVGGGSCTLVRLNLAAFASNARVSGMSPEDFISGPLAEAVASVLEYIQERVRFVMRESGFFESSFLAAEGIIDPSRFTAMFGLVGLAECVNALLAGRGARFGHDRAADELGMAILGEINRLVAAHRDPNLKASGGRYLLHAQVGIDSDSGVSPGCRIPIGEEPPLPQHLLRSAPFHGPFVAGTGDVFAFEPTARANPGQIVDAVKGFFALGGRYFSCYAADSDVIRVTGYLVKRSEVERLRHGEVVPNASTVLGKNAIDNLKVLDRAIRR